MVIFLISSCAPLSWNRSFVDEMNKDDSIFTPGRDFPSVAGDDPSSIDPKKELKARTPASIRERNLELEEEMLKKELRKRENELSEYDRGRYSRLYDQFENDSERNYYLSLSSQERGRYLQSRRISLDSAGAPLELRGLIRPSLGHERVELSLGMGKDDVQNRWGRPHRVDVAGNPRNENERWAFYDNNGMRYVFFERGRVQGWAFE